MALLEDIKKSTERLSGWQRLTSDQIAGLLRQCKCGMFRFGGSRRYGRLI